MQKPCPREAYNFPADDFCICGWKGKRTRGRQWHFFFFLSWRACAASTRQVAFAQLNPHQQAGFDRNEAKMRSGGTRHSAPLMLGWRALAWRPDGASWGQKQVPPRASSSEKSSRPHYVQQASWLLHAVTSFSWLNLIKRISARHCFTQTDL